MGGAAEKGTRSEGAEATGEERQRGDPCIRRIKSKRLISTYPLTLSFHMHIVFLKYACPQWRHLMISLKPTVSTCPFFMRSAFYSVIHPCIL